MEKYTKPILSIIEMDNISVITTSGTGTLVPGPDTSEGGDLSEWLP